MSTSDDEMFKANLDALGIDPNGKVYRDPEICICAAWWTKGTDADIRGKLIRGQRHHDCLNAMVYRDLEPCADPDAQGFVTSRNRFVTREEGYRLQIAAGIESAAEGGYRGAILFSEDLYE